MSDPVPGETGSWPPELVRPELARQLRDAGLVWEPAEGDLFLVPDRDLHDPVFMISSMVVEVRTTPAGPVMAFNGTTEWALDSIMQREVIWLPREDQLRDRLGRSFQSLQAGPEGMRCVVDRDGEPVVYEAVTAPEAYGRALLHLLLHG